MIGSLIVAADSTPAPIAHPIGKTMIVETETTPGTWVAPPPPPPHPDPRP